MKHLTYSRPHHLGKLHEELLAAAAPALAPTLDSEGVAEASFTISGDGETVWLEVPDDADEAAIAAIVTAHDPTPPPPNNATVIRSRLAARILEIEDLAAKLQANAGTADDRTRLLVLVAHGVARLSRLELNQLDKAT